MKRLIGGVLAAAVVASSLACARPLALKALRAGIAAAQADDWEAAVRHWTETVRAEPRSAPAHNNLAIAHEKRGDQDQLRRLQDPAGGGPGEEAMRASAAVVILAAAIAAGPACRSAGPVEVR